MVTITINEATLNAALAGLDERTTRLELTIAHLETQSASEDRDRALVWSIAALHETRMARIYLGGHEAADHPADSTYAA